MLRGHGSLYLVPSTGSIEVNGVRIGAGEKARAVRAYLLRMRPVETPTCDGGCHLGSVLPKAAALYEKQLKTYTIKQQGLCLAATVQQGEPLPGRCSPRGRRQALTRNPATSLRDG